MNINDFELLSQLVKSKSGLILTRDKMYLLESRLTPVARKFGMAGIDALAQAIRVKNDAKIIEEVVDAMTTNESFFFRDIKPFDLFRDNVLPTLLQSRASSSRLPDDHRSPRIGRISKSSNDRNHSKCLHRFRACRRRNAFWRGG